MSDRPDHKAKRRSLSLWVPPVPDIVFRDRQAHSHRVPTAEEKARDDEQVRRLEAALIKRPA